MANSGAFQKGIKKPNQGKRGPDKVLPAARAAIADFVDGNAHRLVGWLDQVANGLPKLDDNGEPLPGEYQLRPDPAKAFDLFQSVIEYHIPKLARTEQTGPNGGAIHHTFEWLK